MPAQENEAARDIKEAEATELNTEAITEVQPAAAPPEPAPQPAGAEEQAAPATPEVDIEALRAELNKAVELAGAERERALRARAEMENLQKRAARDVENAHKYALQGFVGELLPIMDSLQLGLAAAGDTEAVRDLREGMALTLKMFSAALEKFGVRVIDPLDEKFNPEQHEAVSMQEAEGRESGTVISVMQKGYELNGRLIRAATVMVAR